jgi:integrase/recombinase XerD
MQPRFQQFINERQFLQNVTPATVEWYKHSLKWLRTDAPVQEDLKDAVIRMRERGLKPTGCNSVIRCLNAYLKWSGSTLKIPSMKEPQTVLPTFTAPQVQRLIGWKPRGFYQRRLHLLVLILLDTGCRVSEALTLHVVDVDLDNLLLTLDGKGQKQRRVPFSFELRKVLYRFIADHRKPDLLLLASRNETKLDRHVMLQAVKRLCERLGFDPPPRTIHALRHTFATAYVRRGGSVLHLQRVLGHSTLEMTRRYVDLQTADLQAVHERVSLLTGHPGR